MATTFPLCRSTGCFEQCPSQRAVLCLKCRLKSAIASGRRSKGNRKTGSSKRAAGKRSGLKRCANYCLVVKKEWLDLILSGAKDWEIRGHETKRRGWFHFAESGSGGKLVGRARLVDCFRITKKMFKENFHHHRVPQWTQVSYKNVYAWSLKSVQRFRKPLSYQLKQGPVIWVKLS